jgi:hypothetical protein
MLCGSALPVRYGRAIAEVAARNFWGTENFTNFRPQLREKEGEAKQLTKTKGKTKT